MTVRTSSPEEAMDDNLKGELAQARASKIAEFKELRAEVVGKKGGGGEINAH